MNRTDGAALIPSVEAGMRGAEIALAFKPRDRWPKAFQYYRLYW